MTDYNSIQPYAQILYARGEDGALTLAKLITDKTAEKITAEEFDFLKQRFSL